MEDKFDKDNLMARWLDNRLNEDEKKLVEESEALDDLKVVLDDIDTWKVKKFDAEAGLKDLQKRKRLVISPASEKPKKSVFNNWLSIAASILVLITGAYFSWIYFSNASTTITTLVAEQKTEKLPCGSVITLDAVSSINYQKKEWKNNRTIHLKGQAYFDVAKGSTFKVITDKGTVTVLGTEFNINTYNDSFSVQCFEGKVKVVYNTDEKILTQGTSVFVNGNALVDNTHTQTTPDWLNGFSKFDKANLPDVIADLNKYYNLEIDLPSKYKNLEFTGTLPHKDVNEALENLFASMEITYTLEGDKVIFK